MPWQEIPVSDRITWMRIYGAEIYAAGGYFAFPVHGPFGCDSLKDGTLETIVSLANFYDIEITSG